MYQYTECRISYQLVTFIHFQSRIFAAAKKINIVFMKDSIDFGNMEIPRLFRKWNGLFRRVCNHRRYICR